MMGIKTGITKEDLLEARTIVKQAIQDDERKIMAFEMLKTLITNTTQVIIDYENLAHEAVRSVDALSDALSK